MTIKLSGEAPLKQKRSNSSNNPEFKFPSKTVLLQRRTSGDNLPLALQGKQAQVNKSSARR